MTKHHMISTLGHQFFVDVENKLISEHFCAFLGITATEIPKLINPQPARQVCDSIFASREMYYFTMPQVYELLAKAVNRQFSDELIKVINKKVLPLFNEVKFDEVVQAPIVNNAPVVVESQSQKFHSDLFGDLTVLTHDDGSLWFIGKEVAEKLGYSNSSDAINRHCKGVVKHESVTGTRLITQLIIPERDVYRLVMRSKLPHAEKFEEFVVSEILPSIRKNGSYGQVAAPAAPQPAELSRKDLLLIALKSEEEKERLQFERDEAVRCKSWISESREASAMGKLARANDKVRQLEAKLAIVKQAPEYAYATVLAIQSRLKHLKVSGLKLTYYCRNNGLLVKDIPDDRYGVVHSYPAAAWKDVYQIDINNVLNKVA